MELFIYISKSAAILALFYIVYIAVLRKDTFFTVNRHYLLGGIIAAAVIPYIEFTKEVYVNLPVSNPSTFPDEVLLTQVMAPEEALMINWWQVALIIYGIGTTVMLLRFLKQLRSLLYLLKKYPSEKKGGYTYIVVPNNCAPFSFFKYIIYNPSMHTQEELSMILKHEEIHGSQWHSLDIILTNLMLIFQWINPLAWFYKKRIEENLEFLADNATVREVESIKQYQLALVKASSTIPIPALTNNFYQSFIKKRIVMLNKSTSKKFSVWKLSIILPLLALFLWSFNVKEVVTYTEAENKAVSNPVTSTIDSEENSNSYEEVKDMFAMDDSSEELIETSDILVEKRNPEVQSTIISEEKGTTAITQYAIQDILLKITKDTTKEELDAMKAELEKEGFTFDYSNLDYNAKNEIISISFKYKSANGNSGNYSVHSDSPINTIIITAEGKSISINSSGRDKYVYSYDFDFNHDDEMRERNEEMKVRHYEMRERNEEMMARQHEMEEKREEMKIKREEMREEMKERRKEMQEERKERRKESREYDKVLILDGDGTTVDLLHDGDHEDGLFEIHELDGDDHIIHVDRISSRDRNDRIRSHNSLFSKKLRRITKNSSKSDLEKLKNEFKSEGVTFSYSSVKRNDAGEITKIKLKLKDNNGSMSSSYFDGEGKPIKPIKVGIDKGTTVMYSNRY